MKRYGPMIASSLFKKLFLLLVVSFYIPLVMVGYITYYKSSEQIEKVSAAFLADNLSYNENRIQEVFEDIEQHSVQIYASENIQSLLNAFNGGRMEEFEYIGNIALATYELSKDNAYYVSIYPADAERFQAYDLMRANSPVADADWLKRTLQYEGSGYWTNEIRSDFSGLRSDFYYLRPIRSLKLPFEVIGVLSIRVPSPQIAGRILVLDRYPNHRVSLFDEEGRDLLHPERPNSSIAYRLTERASSGERTFRVVEGAEGQYYAAASAGIGTPDWSLAATIPLSDVKGPIHQLRQSTWAIVLASLVLIAALLAFITNSFTVPIRAVVGKMRRLNIGVLEFCESFAGRKDEIGQLVSGYNGMIRDMLELLETTKASERDKRKLEIQMLMHQINPHLLYNTLDSIKWKAESAGERSIAEMSTLLANLLRFSLNDGEEMTTVEREIEHVKCYLNIEQHRIPGGFQAMTYVQPDLWNLPYMKLSIQPIVENCVKHAMKKMPHGEGKIMIFLQADRGDIVCTVEDNGPGCSDEVFDTLRNLDRNGGDRSLVGIGLSNVNKRLQAHFGPAYGIVFERLEPHGFRATLRQPMP